MKFEILETEKGQIFIMSPPTYFDLPIFLVLHTNIKSWTEQDWFLKAEEETINIPPELHNFKIGFCHVFEAYLSLFTYRTRHVIDRRDLGNRDLREIVRVGDKLLETSDLPLVGDETEEKTSQVVPRIVTTGDEYSNLLGDLIKRIGDAAITLSMNYDFETIRQVLNRVDQWSYWEDPKNYQRLKEQIEASDVLPDLYALQAAKEAGNVKYMGSKTPTDEERQKGVFSLEG